MRTNMTIDAEKKFEQELQVFISEVELASQCFHAWLAIHRTAAKDKRIHRAMNKRRHFWNTVLYSLQLSYVIVLGRLFGRNTHGVDRLLKLAQDSVTVFDRNALAKRKERMGFRDASTELTKYVSNAYIPEANDFRQLRKGVDTRRKIYEQKFAPLRNKVFAHAEVLGEEARNELFDKTTVGELRDLLLYLKHLGYSLRDLFMNGRKPDVEHEFRSGGYSQIVEQQISEDTEQLLREI